MVKLTNAQRAAKGEITIDPWPHLNDSTQRYARAIVAMARLQELIEEAETDAHENYTRGRYHTAASHFARASSGYRDLADQLSKASAALYDGPKLDPQGGH